MTEEEKQKGKDEPDSAPEQEKPEDPGKAAGSEERQGGGAAESSAAEKARELTMSDELRMALEEAEAAVTKKKRKQKAAPAGEEEVEIDLDEEGADPAFDPNRVDEAEDEGPIKPSPAEVQLKMQILDLRQQLRAAEQDIEQKAREVKQNREQAQHIQKQFDSYKGRMMKEKADVFNYGHEPLLKELLAVVDNLERALQHAVEAANVEAVAEGVQLIMRQFMGILEKFGVSSVEPSGQQFDPEFHQAMLQTEDDSVPANTVVQVHQKGYLLKDRLLRPAMVVVSKRGPKPEAEDAAEGASAESEGGEDAGDRKE